jgi:hypothetical protein
MFGGLVILPLSTMTVASKLPVAGPIFDPSVIVADLISAAILPPRRRCRLVPHAMTCKVTCFS